MRPRLQDLGLRGRSRSRRPQPPPGSPPGLLIADPAAPAPVIRVMAYGPEGFTEEMVGEPEQIRGLVERWARVWVNVDGLGDAATVGAIGAIFGLHELALEDVLNARQRGKAEQYGEHVFLVARMPLGGDEFETEQLSVFFSRSFLVTFQEKPGGDCFDLVRQRLRQGRGQMRESGSDYLAYTLLDAVIDSYFPILEREGERLDAMEDELVGRRDDGLIPRIHAIKVELLGLRRAVWPLRETVNALLRERSPTVSEETRTYLRDCYDHTVQLIDLLEIYRETGSDLFDFYISMVSHRTNEVIKVLTIFTTVFMPLTFIAGIYGMNFNTERSPWNMPELDWHFGYPLVLAVMGAVALVLLLYFRSRGWLRSRRG